MENTPIPSPLVSTTPPRTMPTGLWLVMTTIAFGLGIAGGYLIWGKPAELAVQRAQATAQAAQTAVADVAAQAVATEAANAPDDSAQQEQQQVKRYDVPVDDDPILGKADAKITIIEFSDYECPFCQKWHTEVWPEIAKKYPDDVRLVYRDFPLYGMHANAEPAALAAACAGEQEKYWEMHNLLLNASSLGRSTFDEFAETLNLDTKAFGACLDESRYEDEVKADYQFAADLGISSTPTFFINGLAIVGAQPFEVFDRIISMELAGEIPQN